MSRRPPSHSTGYNTSEPLGFWGWCFVISFVTFAMTVDMWDAEGYDLPWYFLPWGLFT